jgi:hypothetical protein
MDKRITLLADALYYTRADSGASCEKAQGVVIGAVSVIMGMNKIGFFDALEIVKRHMPKEYRIEAIPTDWQDAF